MRKDTNNHRLWTAGLAVAALLSSLPAAAAPIEVTGINMFRDFRGPNDVGQISGDRLQYGANVRGGSLGTSLGAVYPPTGFSDPAVACSPLAVNANHCSNSTPFNAARIAVPWQLTFTRPGESPLSVPGPSLAGTDFRVPMPTSVTISGTGTTPRIEWTLPAGYVPDAFRVQIYDRSRLRVGGNADIIHTDAVPANARGYTVPATLDTGGSLVPGGNYAISLQVIETRNNVAFTNLNAQILSRSNAFFAFSPLPPGAPQNVHLPVIDTSSGVPVHRFSDIPVAAHQVIFIDPVVAIGYDYVRDAGSPNFESVLLPTGIGDNLFDLFLWDGAAWYDTSVDLVGGDRYFFGAGGVDRFRILGIEVSESLDPYSTSAFITGVSFVSSGVFNGAMIPLVVAVAVAHVAEPGTVALLAGALMLIGVLGRAGRRR